MEVSSLPEELQTLWGSYIRNNNFSSFHHLDVERYCLFLIRAFEEGISIDSEDIGVFLENAPCSEEYKNTLKSYAEFASDLLDAKEKLQMRRTQ